MGERAQAPARLAGAATIAQTGLDAGEQVIAVAVAVAVASLGVGIPIVAAVVIGSKLIGGAISGF